MTKREKRYHRRRRFERLLRLNNSSGNMLLVPLDKAPNAFKLIWEAYYSTNLP